MKHFEDIFQEKVRTEYGTVFRRLSISAKHLSLLVAISE